MPTKQVVHLKVGKYDTGRDKILCNRFIKKETVLTTTNDKERVTCGLCIMSIKGL